MRAGKERSVVRAFLEQLQVVVGEEERRHHHLECNNTERQTNAKKEKWPLYKKLSCKMWKTCHLVSEYGTEMVENILKQQDYYHKRRKICRP